MSAVFRLACAATLGLVLLTGCEKQKNDKAQASGEVLQGTVSDAMIETDRVRSEAPLAPRSAGARGKTEMGSSSEAPPSEAANAGPDGPAGDGSAPESQAAPETKTRPAPEPAAT